MSKTEQTVYISRQESRTRPHYHLDQDCQNAPRKSRPIAKSKIPHHNPCAMCVDHAESTETACNSAFECAECGRIAEIHSSACRTRHGCFDCGEVTRHERIEQ